jgi:hypothetical protein
MMLLHGSFCVAQQRFSKVELVVCVPKLISVDAQMEGPMQHGLARPGVQPAPFASVQAGGVEHTPPTQLSAPHECPHEPQFALSVLVLTQVLVAPQ